MDQTKYQQPQTVLRKLLQDLFSTHLFQVKIFGFPPTMMYYWTWCAMLYGLSKEVTQDNHKLSLIQDAPIYTFEVALAINGEIKLGWICVDIVTRHKFSNLENKMPTWTTRTSFKLEISNGVVWSSSTPCPRAPQYPLPQVYTCPVNSLHVRDQSKEPRHFNIIYIYFLLY